MFHPPFVARLKAKRAVVESEAVVLSEVGLADFHAIRGALDGRSKRLRLYAFGLLTLDGEDLRELPLLEESQFEGWMRGLADQGAAMMQPYAGAVDLWPVSSEVGNVRYNRPELMQRSP